MDSEKFPQFAADKLLQHKWLRGVENVGLLHLLWIPHYHCGPITIFFIWKLLCLVPYGYLWLEDSIPIMDDLIHRISWLPIKGNNATNIIGKCSDLCLVEAMKAKYKLEKRKRRYVINSKHQGPRGAPHHPATSWQAHEEISCRRSASIYNCVGGAMYREGPLQLGVFSLQWIFYEL